MVLSPVLVALTDHDAFADSAARLVRLCEVAREGSVAVVLRDKDRLIDERLVWGRRLREACTRSGQLFVVADRLDLALALEADGVHLPGGGITPTEVGRLHSFSWVSMPIHAAESIPRAELLACSAVLISPVFEARKGRKELGLVGLSSEVARVEAIARSARVVALGGVDERSAPGAIKAGARGIAAIGAVHVEHKREALVRALGILRP